jgi:hypothetical protein
MKIDNPLLKGGFTKKDQLVETMVSWMRDPDNLWFVCKYILNVDLLPFQVVILKQLWTKPFPMLIATRGGSKSFILTVYIALRALLDQGAKIVVVGAALRQSLVLYNYLQAIWQNAPVLQDICGGMKFAPKRDLHMCSWKCGKSEVKFLPLGNGETIRGQRATVVIADEFASIPPDVFETVVRGFAAVKSVGLVESVAEKFRHKTMEALGLVFEGNDQAKMDVRGTATQTNLGCNQIVIAGTTTFTFNHFYKYYTYYRAIIESCGDPAYLRQNYPDMVLPPNIDSTQYSIMRIPYDLIPPGMMDESILSQGRATMNSVIFDQEYGCIFPSDSDGFYPATDIHRATCPINTTDGVINFGAEMYGDTSCWYTMGIDPASEKDHFAICLIKIMGPHRHVVYQWSTNRKRYLELKERGKVDSSITDYTTFCVKHIRNLLRRFPVKLICCDIGGGGLSIKEGLIDADKMDKGDVPIYDMDDENMRGNQGAYILKMIAFQNAEWRKESHYGLKKDISDKRILFPLFDTVQVASTDYMENSKDYETLDECYTEIEECKYETILIKHDMTNTGTERWDVPKLKISGADEIKKSLKKDRFTSLLLANWACRLIHMDEMNQTNYTVIGRSLSTQIQPRKETTLRYIGPNGKKMIRMGANSSVYRSFNS